MYGRLHYFRQSMGIWFWGCFVPVAGLLGAYWTYGASVAFVGCMYTLLWYRAYKGVRIRAMNSALAREYAFFNVLSKFPMLAGALQYWYRRSTGKKARIIEYRKTVAPPEGAGA